MSWFSNLTVRVKLLAGFIVLAVIALIVGFVGIRNMGTMNGMAEVMYQRELLGVSHIKEANAHLLALVRAEKNIILAPTEEMRQAYVNNYANQKNELLDHIGMAKPLFRSDHGKEMLAELDRAWREYEPISKKIIDMALSEKLNEKRASAELSMGIGREKINEIEKTMAKLSQNKENNAKNQYEETTRIYQQSRMFLIVLVVVAMIVGMIIGMFLSRNIGAILKSVVDEAKNLADACLAGKLNTRCDTEKINFEFRPIARGFNEILDALIKPLDDTSDYIERISKGDIPEKITAEYKGDFNRIKDSLNLMIDSMNKIAEVAQEMAAGNVNLQVKQRSDGDELMKSLNELIAANKMVTEVAQDLADGNLTVSVKERSEKDELMQALKEMVARLKDVVVDIKSAADNVAAGSEQMSSAAEEMSQGASEQASAAEEASSSMEQMA
ncbi:MAG: MCP four helix bundle domain-containing protein, partial [Deltaproteobacteria bacterium]|nr:MCP four helix bundle domain-containing protein [Deltaproteobacteria bacterium]